MTVDGLRYNIEFWDTAGSERFRALTPSFFRRAQGVILVYDIGNRESFLELQRWYDETFVYVDSAVVLVMANKLDAGRVVEREEGVRFARHHATMFMEVSAKDNTNISDTIDHLINKVKKINSTNNCNNFSHNHNCLMFFGNLTFRLW